MPKNADDAEDARNVQAIARVTISALKTLNTIHAVACDGEPGALDRIRVLARTEILDTRGVMADLDTEGGWRSGED
jgi:hypothetical protein